MNNQNPEQAAADTSNQAPCRIVVLISGTGSNLQKLIELQKAEQIAGELVGVISNRPEAPGLKLAANAGIATAVVDHKAYDGREPFDAELARVIDTFQPDLLVLAGFMRILTPRFVNRYTGRMLNIHPSLLPKYQGLKTHHRAIENQDKVHGATVHFVTEELDGGPCIIQGEVPVLENDIPAVLAKRVQLIEHYIYPQAVHWFASGRLEYQPTGVLLDGEPLPSRGLVVTNVQ